MDRERRFDDPRRGGESYRPQDRNVRRSPRPDTRPFRSPSRNRSPVRPTADTWAPPGRPRPRSRSPNNFRGPRSRSPPPFRGRDRGPSFVNRSRSPPRRPISPGHDRPPRFNWRSRSPPPFDRNRSPGLKRGREPSPSAFNMSRGPKRERNISPPRNKFDRQRSPFLNESMMPREMPMRDIPPRDMQLRDTRPGIRRRSRSIDRRSSRGDPFGGRGPPPRSPSIAERSAQNSTHGSAATSRRSSPPTQERTNRNYSNTTASTHGPSLGMSRSQYGSGHVHGNAPRYTEGGRRPPSRPPSPPRRPPAYGQLPSPRSHESPRLPHGEIEQDRSENAPARPPTGPRGESSPAAVGQGTSMAPGGISPPLGPSATQRSTRQPTRGGHMSMLSAPTRPKGGPGGSFSRDGPPTGPRESTRPGPGPSPGSIIRRGSSHTAPSQHHGHPPPSGPRGASGPPTSGPPHDARSRPPFRHGNGTSTTYPRTQRFTNHLAGLPTIVPGGKLLPSSLDPSTEKRLAQLEADKEKLLEQIAEKQRAKRASLREWDKLCRESSIGALRTDLADGHLQRMSEAADGIGSGVPF